MRSDMTNREFSDAMKQRTKAYAVRVIEAVEALPDKPACWDLGRQLLRAATSVASNYRAACRSRSTAEFIAKLGNVEEEADEALLWMELLIDAGYCAQPKLSGLMTEGNEILRIIVTAIKSTRPVASSASEDRQASARTSKTHR